MPATLADFFVEVQAISSDYNIIIAAVGIVAVAGILIARLKSAAS